MANREELLRFFDTGDRPTQHQMQDFINSTINIEEGNSQFISDVFCLSSGSNDTFHQLAPPFVPNLQEYIKVVNFDPHVGLSMSSSFDDLTINSGTPPTTLFAEKIATTNEIFPINSTFGAGGFGFVGGGFNMKAGSGGFNTLMSTIKPFEIRENTPFWLKTKVRIPNEANTNFFFGLANFNGNSSDTVENGGSVGQARSFLGILKNNVPTANKLKAFFRHGIGDSTLPFFFNNTKFTQTLSLAAVADDDVLNLGIIHNGKKDFYFYTSKGNNPMTLDTIITKEQIIEGSVSVANGNDVSNTENALVDIDGPEFEGTNYLTKNPNEMSLNEGGHKLRLMLHMSYDSGTSENIQFEYIQGAILTNTSS